MGARLDPGRGRAALAAVALTALAVRAWFVLEEHPPGRYVVVDMAMYVERATHLRGGTVSAADTLTPPGWPALIALAQAISPASWATLLAVLHAVLGAATCALVHRLAHRLGRSEAVAATAAFATAAYLPLIFYEGLLLSETTVAFGVALGAWLALRAVERPTWGRCTAAGSALGLTSLVHANLALALPLLLLVDRRVAARALPAGLALVAAASLHASLQVGHPTGIATNGGVNFFLAHSDCGSVRLPEGDPVSAIVPRANALRGDPPCDVDVHAWDEGAFYARGLQAIAARPARLLTDLRNVRDGLGQGDLAFWPGWMAHEDWLRAFSRAFAWMALLPAAAYGLLRAARRTFTTDPARPWLWLLVGQAIVTLYVYLGDPRIRVPFDPLVLALAAEAWVAAARALARRARRPRC